LTIKPSDDIVLVRMLKNKESNMMTPLMSGQAESRLTITRLIMANSLGVVLWFALWIPVYYFDKYFGNIGWTIITVSSVLGILGAGFYSDFYNSQPSLPKTDFRK